MRKYMCPKCKQVSLIVKKHIAKCVNCGYEMSIKGVSRMDLYHKKHIDKPIFIAPEHDLVKKTIPKVHKSIQHFEGIVSRTLRSIPYCWYTKLQVNPLAHQSTVGDFMILTPTYNIVLECKELNITSSGAYFSFTRITQLHKLIAFESAIKRNKGYIGILLYSQNQKELYIIPISVMRAVIDFTKQYKQKNGLTVVELQHEFENYKIPFCNLEHYIKNNWL